MSRCLPAIAVIGLAALSAAPAAAQDNPILGLWQHSEPASQFGPASTTMVAFAADDTFETRMAVPSSWGGYGAGIVIVRGQYHLTGPDSYVYREATALMCAAGSPCVPSPIPMPNFRTPKTVHFAITGPGTMSTDGVDWIRVR